MKGFGLLAVVAVLVGALNCATSRANDGWIELACDASFESWQEDGRLWTVAGGASLDPTAQFNLLPRPGTGVLISSQQEDSEESNLTSNQLFADLEAHMEFLVPQGSNGGVKFQGLYEIQIRDTYGKENPVADDCGGIYPRAEVIPRYHLIDEGFPPRVNAARPPGQWQTLDVEFQAPRFDTEGRKTDNARFLKVVLNDQVIHENVELRWPTGHAWRTKEEVAEGPLYLQGDHGPIAYRNIRVRPIVAASE